MLRHVVPNTAVAGQHLIGRCLLSLVCKDFCTHICIRISTGILPCKGFVHPWTNTTYSLADLAASVQHLLLGIRCLGIQPVFKPGVPAYCLHRRNLQRRFPGRQQTHQRLPYIHNIWRNLLPEHRRHHRLLRMNRIQCSSLARSTTAC